LLIYLLILFIDDSFYLIFVVWLGHDELPDPGDVPSRRDEKEEDAERS
jgi:hypothetical protein